ncbi:MAG TPA: choice-of-anchor tandem repeat GloVer-containing protein [Rhizomicrobium sp.]|nr:choice-of-anchor tandem repeat GloVer-containing protein [Rhizomicrobium sp.]
MRKLSSFLIALAAAALLAVPAQAAQFHRLYSFCGDNCGLTGGDPDGGLVADAAGNLYGATSIDGVHGRGTVFELSPRGATGKYTFRTLYHFCARVSCTDGARPEGALVIDTAGNLYGTTQQGGAAAEGTAFRLSPIPDTHKFTYSVLYDFCSRDSSCPDGIGPMAGLSYAGQLSGLPYDGISPLYGVAGSGGRYAGGTVFSLNRRSNDTWFARTLYAFCAIPDCSDGRLPSAVIADALGNLYGTTRISVDFASGVAFKLVKGTKECCWNETVLHSFCSGCSGGYAPQGLTMDGAGNLFGTTLSGGVVNSACQSSTCGVAYRIAPDTTFTVLHEFCTVGDCFDGANPSGPLLLDSSGNLFGTAQKLGRYNGGTLFEIASGGGVATLHAFCREAQCADGQAPMGALATDPSGALYGVANRGGDRTFGSVWKVTP